MQRAQRRAERHGLDRAPRRLDAWEIASSVELPGKITARVPDEDRAGSPTGKRRASAGSTAIPEDD